MPAAFTNSSCVGSGETAPSNAKQVRQARLYLTEALQNVYLAADRLPSIPAGSKFFFYNPENEECYYIDGVDNAVNESPGQHVLEGWEEIGINAVGEDFWVRLCESSTDPCTPGGGSGSYVGTLVGSLSASGYELPVSDADSIWGRNFAGSHPSWTNSDGEDRPYSKHASGFDEDDNPIYDDSIRIDGDLTALSYDDANCLWLIKVYLTTGELLVGYAKNTGTSAVGVYSKAIYAAEFPGDTMVGTGSNYFKIA